MEISFLNTQIATLQASIYSMNVQLNQKREELERLKTAFSELMDYQNDFHQNELVCSKPELSRMVWYGQLASDFSSFRDDDLHSSYRIIINEQFTGAITILKEKIKEIQQAIDTLNEQVFSTQSNLNNFNEQKRKELMK